ITRLAKRARPLHPGSTETGDTPERIKTRLAMYKEGEKDVLDFYRTRGALVEINADQSIEQVHADIMQNIQKNG
ncbi:MAG: hypothetical protein NT149_01560, partial [Candidatus Gottesmanbacteria bacterium]|nr:hypothetical protein [Candidatus Gottesmanbacteria bacterium]